VPNIRVWTGGYSLPSLITFPHHFGSKDFVRSTLTFAGLFFFVDADGFCPLGFRLQLDFAPVSFSAVSADMLLTAADEATGEGK